MLNNRRFLSILDFVARVEKVWEEPFNPNRRNEFQIETFLRRAIRVARLGYRRGHGNMDEMYAHWLEVETALLDSEHQKHEGLMEVFSSEEFPDIDDAAMNFAEDLIQEGWAEP